MEKNNILDERHQDSIVSNSYFLSSQIKEAQLKTEYENQKAIAFKMLDATIKYGKGGEYFCSSEGVNSSTLKGSGYSDKSAYLAIDDWYKKYIGNE